MNFQPQTEAELEEDRRKRMKILKKGEADFVVKTALDKHAQKNGVEMIELQIEVTDADGTSKVLKDWLHPALMHRIRHFCYAVGLGSIYERGELCAEHCVGRGGRCMVIIESSEEYGDQNKVRDYVVAGQTKETPGYQTAKGNGAAKPPSDVDQAKRRAWTKYKAKFPQSPTDELQEGFRQSVAGVFPGKKAELLSAADWDRFVAGGFVKVMESPISEEPAFAESDIPF